jgi:hypothetical protein
MRCTEKRVRIQKNGLLTSNLEGYAPSFPKNLGRDGARPSNEGFGVREKVAPAEALAIIQIRYAGVAQW